MPKFKEAWFELLLFCDGGAADAVVLQIMNLVKINVKHYIVCMHAHAAAEWARPMPLDYPETWDEPDDSFESFVSETVRYRLGKYVTQPDHHTRVSSEDAHVLYR